MRVAAAIALFLFAGPAQAHATPAWAFEPLVAVPLLAGLWLYVRSFRYLRAVQRAGVALGMAVLLAALVWPLGTLAEGRLSAHMVQHALLVAVAPPLLLLGHPAALFAWGLPPSWRGAWKPVARAYRSLSRPLPAALLHGAALWLWHAPAPFDAAIGSAPLHAMEHASFVGTALLFWSAVLAGRSPRAAASALPAAFATLLHSGLLGALITLAPVPLYAGSSLEEQQLAGLIMWVPMGGVYLTACLVLACRLLKESAIQAPGLPRRSTIAK